MRKKIEALETNQELIKQVVFAVDSKVSVINSAIEASNEYLGQRLGENESDLNRVERHCFPDTPPDNRVSEDANVEYVAQSSKPNGRLRSKAYLEAERSYKEWFFRKNGVSVEEDRRRKIETYGDRATYMKVLKERFERRRGIRTAKHEVSSP